MAEERMDGEGYNGNFSAYVAELIRRDKRESEKVKSGAMIVPPSEPGGTSRLNEPQLPCKPRK